MINKIFYSDTFAKENELINFVNEQNITPISVVYIDYKWKLFYVKELF